MDLAALLELLYSATDRSQTVRATAQASDSAGAIEMGTSCPAPRLSLRYILLAILLRF